MSRPNILIFMPDQQRADCLDCYGNPFVQTSNFDGLAACGMGFGRPFANPLASADVIRWQAGPRFPKFAHGQHSPE
ncbi:MAG: hypothetical protein P8N51_00820 [Pseudomonadales bacterium]|nr:hypothetical protein [Pseudomonadales bacterium]MDG1441421.1 hypothetical protein [Pseudomonadales bacterium]